MFVYNHLPYIFTVYLISYYLLVAAEVFSEVDSCQFLGSLYTETQSLNVCIWWNIDRCLLLRTDIWYVSVQWYQSTYKNGIMVSAIWTWSEPIVRLRLYNYPPSRYIGSPKIHDWFCANLGCKCATTKPVASIETTFHHIF